MLPTQSSAAPDTASLKEELKEEVVDDGQPVVVRPEPEKVLLEWRAAVRPFKRRTRQFWATAMTMGFLVGLIFFFIEGWMPVAVIIAFLFLLYVRSSVPPEEIVVQMTTRGIKVGETKYLWREMVRFWFSEQWGQRLINIDIMRLPGRLVFLLGEAKEEEVREAVSKYLPYEEAKPTWVDRAATWVGKKLPMEGE